MGIQAMQSYSERIREHGRFTDKAQEIIRQIPARIGSRSEQFSAEIVPTMAVWTLIRWEDTLSKCMLTQCSGEGLAEMEAAIESRLLQFPRNRPDPTTSVVPIPREFGQAMNDLVERSIELATNLDTNYVGTEHLLLAALTLDNKLSDLMAQHGVTRDKLERLLHPSSPRSEER